MPSGQDIVQRLGRQSIAYSLASVVGPGTGLLLLPLYTRFLTPEDYGLIALLEIISLLFGTIFSFGMSAIVPFYYVDPLEPEERRRALGTLVNGITVLNVVLAALTIFAGRPVVRLLLPSVPFSPYVPILAFTALFEPYWIMYGATLQIKERAGFYSMLSIGRIFVSVALRIVWVVVLGRGVYGFVMANLLATMVTAAAVTPLLVREAAFVFIPREIVKAFRFGAPTVPNNLLTYGFRVIDRIVMDRFVTRDTIGLYYMAMRIADVLRMVAEVMISSWRPIFFKETGDSRFVAVIAPRVIRVLSLGFIAAFVVLSVFAREALQILTAPRYQGAAVFVPLLVGAMAVKAIYTFPYLAVWDSRKTYWVSLLTFLTMLFSLGANLVLGRRWGAIGVAVALLLSYTFLLALMSVLARRLHPVRYPWRQILTAAALAGGIVAVSTQVGPGAAGFVIKLLLVCTYGGGLLLTGCVTRQDVRQSVEPARALLRGRETVVTP